MGRTIRYYTDENIANAVIRGLRDRGVDVLSVAETGMYSAPDEEHLETAHTQGRVVFTQDADFLRLHAAGVDHSGIVFAPQGTSVGTMIRGLMLIWEVFEPDDMMGHVEYI